MAGTPSFNLSLKKEGGNPRTIINNNQQHPVSIRCLNSQPLCFMIFIVILFNSPCKSTRKALHFPNHRCGKAEALRGALSPEVSHSEYLAEPGFEPGSVWVRSLCSKSFTVSAVSSPMPWSHRGLGHLSAFAPVLPSPLAVPHLLMGGASCECEPCVILVNPSVEDF